MCRTNFKNHTSIADASHRILKQPRIKIHKNITACVTQSIKTLELDQSVCTLLLTNVKIFLQNDKKSIFEGSGVGAKNSSKTWSKCHFLLLYRRKSGQKVGKTQSFTRGFLIFQDGPFFRLFHGFS